MMNNSLIGVALLLLTFPVTAMSRDEVCFYASKGFAADVTFQRTEQLASSAGHKLEVHGLTEVRDANRSVRRRSPAHNR
jgi:hypothetical protein